MSAPIGGEVLAGWRVLVPRPAGRADELLALLRAVGAEPRHVPLLATRPEADSCAMRRSVTTLAAGGYDWVAFTSAAAVSAVLTAADHAGLPRPVGGRTRVAAVGPATARALREAGIRVDLIPDGAGSGSALAAAWPADPPGASVLLPRSGRAAATLPDALRASGHRVVTVRAYTTALLPVPENLARDLAAGLVDAVLLTSPSAADALATAGMAERTVVVAIGGPTARAAALAGLPVTATAAHPTAAGLIRALAGVAATHPRSRNGP